MLKDTTQTRTKSRKRRPRSLTELVRILRARMPELVERYGIRSLGIFGSYLRGEQKPRSDFDVLVEFDQEQKTWSTIIAMEEELGKALGVKVDLIENKNLKPFIGNRIRSEVVWLRRDGKDLPIRLSRRKNGDPQMAAKREYLDFLADIVKAMGLIIQFVSDVSFDDFVVNEKDISAVERQIGIIGEAVKNIPADVRSRYPEINWSEMAKMRDRLAHGYFSRDLSTLWATVTGDIPHDHPLVSAALEQELRRRAEHDAKKGTAKKNGDG
jgi:uncharacterized protein with HEPN domain/predicted nucleotidyltransferase